MPADGSLPYRPLTVDNCDRAADLATTLHGHLKAKQALDLADYARPNGVRPSGLDRDPPIVRTDAELRREAEARAQAVRDYDASPEGRAEHVRRAAIEAQRVEMQRAFGWAV